MTHSRAVLGSFLCGAADARHPRDFLRLTAGKRLPERAAFGFTGKEWGGPPKNMPSAAASNLRTMPPSHEQSVLPGLSYHPGLRGWLAVRAVRDHSCAGRLLVPHLARFPAVVSALTDPRRRDGGEPGDDVLDGHAWGEHGDRPRRGRGAFGGPLGDPAQCFSG